MIARLAESVTRTTERIQAIRRIESAQVLESVGGALVAAALTLFMWDAFTWLRFGGGFDATGVSAMVNVFLSPSATAWLAHPQSWFGLHQAATVVLDLPLALVCLFSGMGVTWLAEL